MSQSPDCVEKSLICNMLMKPWGCDRIRMFLVIVTRKLQSRKNLITGQNRGIYRVFQFRSFGCSSSCLQTRNDELSLYKSCSFRACSEPGGTRWRTGGEVKGKLANGMGSQYSHATSERGLSSINQADAHTSATSSRLNWRPHRFKWTRPFRGKTKYGFCACTITFRTNYTCSVFHLLKKKVHWGCLRTGGDNSISTKREK